MARLIVVIILILVIVGGSGCSGSVEQSITVFAGSASKPAMEDAAKAFEEETGIKVYINFGGSGTVLSQMKISRSGDLYIPGSPDYMEIARNEGVVDDEKIEIIAYLVPAILVPEGNPANIHQLSDLAIPGIEVGIGNPETVCVGLYAYEIMEFNNLLEEIQSNIVTHAESCSKTATLVALKSVDAVIGWRIFSEWHDTVEVVYLEPDQIPRLAYIPGAVSTFSEEPENARKFLDFLVSPHGQESFQKWGYLTSEAEARKYAPDAEIGGEYKLPDSYREPTEKP